jgi:glycosyltransferase involved in cell wall biosynthesis
VTQAISAPPHRIAFVTGVLDLGGTTTFICNLAGELRRRGVVSRVFSFEQDNPLAEDFERLGIPVFTTDERRLIYEDRLALILRELARFQPTVAIANLSATSFEVLRYVPRGVLRVGTAQSHDPGVYHSLQFYGPHVDWMAAVSRRIQETLAAEPELLGVPVHYLPYGVPLPPPQSRPAPASQAPLRVLYLGRLERQQKRVQLFPEILQGLVTAGIPFHWTIAGTGEEKAWLEARMKTTGPGQSVSFAGKVLYGDVPRLLAEHDIFLLASGYEGLPLSLLEAMAGGLVPVVSDLPSGIREVVDETTGRLVAPGNTAGYAEAVVWLHHHREELGRLSQNASARVRRDFSVQAMADRWLCALPTVAAQPEPWPEGWTIRPILSAPDRWRFSPLARFFRRRLLRFRR